MHILPESLSMFLRSAVESNATLPPLASKRPPESATPPVSLLGSLPLLLAFSGPAPLQLIQYFLLPPQTFTVREHVIVSLNSDSANVFCMSFEGLHSALKLEDIVDDGCVHHEGRGSERPCLLERDVLHTFEADQCVSSHATHIMPFIHHASTLLRPHPLEKY